jgi:ribulose-5-phosphate 4-epimerase/fuculose-1-phosphate aldolase
MKVIDDGVIKYDRSNFTYCSALLEAEYRELEYWRKILYKKNLIGEYPEVNIGFGNMSHRQDYSHIFQSSVPQFIITGTQTGKYSELNASQYTRILDYKISELKINMMGAIEASSEALTHAAIYEQNPMVNAIFHIHSNVIWNKLIENKSDFTAREIPYGTVEMALATQACVKNKNSGVFCMHGHEDGVVIYGESLEVTGKLTLELYDKYFN